MTELVKNLEISKVSLRKETPLIQIIDRPTFPLEKEALDKVKAFVLGTLIGGVLIVMSIILLYAYKKIISDES